MTELSHTTEQIHATALSAALSADREQLCELLLQPSADLLCAALRNPNLEEEHLLALLKQPSLDQDIFAVIHQNKHPAAKSYQVILAIVRHHAAPPHIVSALIPALYLFDLLKFCQLPGIMQDQKLMAERCIIQRIPTQPLGNKLTLARRGTAAVVEALFKDGDPKVLACCLDNPHTKEGMIHQFVSSAAASSESLTMVARHSRWQNRPNLLLALLKNPHTPDTCFMQLAPRLSRSAIKELIKSSRMTQLRRQQLQRLLEGRT